MKKQLLTLRTGVITLIPIFILGLVLSWLWGILASIGLAFAENKILNFTINLILLVVLIYLTGWLLERKWFRSFVQTVLSKIPVIAFFADFFFKNDYLEQMMKNHFPEVEFELLPGVRTIGIITKDGILDSENQEWCRVYAGTCPIPFSGYVFIVKKSQLIYTGRTVEKTIKVWMSFGLQE